MFRCGVLRHRIAAAALCLIGTTAAQADDPPPATAANESQDPSRSKWAAVWGTSPPSGVFYLPYGGHNNALKVASFQLVGGIVKSIYGMTFINSRGARTWSLGFERDVLRFHRLSLGWGAGLMVGYHGSLADVRSPAVSSHISLRAWRQSRRRRTAARGPDEAGSIQVAADAARHPGRLRGDLPRQRAEASVTALSYCPIVRTTRKQTGARGEAHRDRSALEAQLQSVLPEL